MLLGRVFKTSDEDSALVNLNPPEDGDGVRLSRLNEVLAKP